MTLSTTMLSQVGIGTEPKDGRPAKFGLSQGATNDTKVPGNPEPGAVLAGPFRTASWKSTRRATLSVRTAAREPRPIDILGARLMATAETQTCTEGGITLH